MSCFLLPIHFCALIAPSDFALIVSDASGRGTVRMCSVDSPNFTTDPLLTGIRLLECVPASRTAIDESYPGRAQLRSDLAQGTRVQLPGGAGSVYHYERSDAAASRYGFFTIDDNGSAHVLIELPAAPGPSDPFLNSIAAKASGSTLLVATQPNAGGDLWELDSHGGGALNRTENVDPQVFGLDSFFLSSSLGVAVTTDGVLRYDPSANDCADFIGFGGEGAPPWFDLELMPSANGQFIAMIAGDSPAAARPFIVGSNGDAACMDAAPDFMTGAGCLPEATDGPWLAVSDDGMLCAWRVGDSHTYGYDHELYLSRRDVCGQTLAIQVTQDSLFEPYIDEIGLTIFRPGGQLVFMAGDPGLNGSLFSQADLFASTLSSTGTLEVENLSMTSGEPVPPFLQYGQLEVSRLRLRPNSGRALIYSRDAVGNRLLAVEFGQPGAQEVASGVEAVGPLDTSGDDWIVGMEVPGADAQTGLCRVDAGGDQVELLLGLKNFSGATRVLRNPYDPNWYACVEAVGTIEHLLQVDVSNCDSLEFSTREFSFGSSMVYTLDGSLIVSIHVAGGDSLFIVWPGDPVEPKHKLWMFPQPGFILPGA